MWFAKWFGGRDDSNEHDEPARFAAPDLSRQTAPAEARRPPAAAGKSGGKGAAKGFDPYNSGSFDRQNAWERVPRR